MITMQYMEHKVTGRLMNNYGFTLVTCGKCGGEGHLAGYEHSDGARCWRCNGQGRYMTPKVQRAWDECRQAMAARKAGEPFSFTPYWKQGGVKVEDDVVALFRRRGFAD